MTEQTIPRAPYDIVIFRTGALALTKIGVEAMRTPQPEDSAIGLPLTRRDFLRGSVRAATGLLAAAGVGGLVSTPLVARAASTATVAYGRAGLTCEGALFAAEAQGYFRDEGLTLVTTAVASGEDVQGMMDGTIDAMQDPAWTLIPQLMPKGMMAGDMVATAGIQRGSMSLVVAANSAIRSVADLRGQKIAAGPRWRFIFGPRLRSAGLDPQRDVVWQAQLPPAQVAGAIKDGQVAVLAVHQPYAAAIESSGIGRILIAQNSPPFQGDYCCAVIFTGKLVRSDRPKTAAITRALMRGSVWLRNHLGEGAQLEIERNYVTANLADNQHAIKTLDFFPSVAVARRNTLDILERFMSLGLLDPAMGAGALTDQIFVPVTGEISAIHYWGTMS